MDFSADQFAQKELPYFGNNFAGQPLGDYEGYRDIPADENLDGDHDPLVEIKNELLVRPMYLEQGFTNDPRMFLREPALKHFVKYDRLLRENFGWQIRIADGFRPWNVQQKGFCWGVSEVVKNRGEISMEKFLQMLKDAIEGRAADGAQDPAVDVAFLEKYLQEADVFFSYVKPQQYDRALFKGVSDLMVASAANLSLIDLPLNPYTGNSHASGGVADIEWVEVESGRLVNTGVPVDTQGLEGAMAFFEDRIPPILEQSFKAENLQTVEDRKAYYKRKVAEKPLVSAYLKACGVDLDRFSAESSYFDEIWLQIKQNRRKVVNLADSIDLLFFGLESWHVNANDERGGVRFKRIGVASGSGEYAVQKAQQQGAWGSAGRLWEKLVKS